MKSEANTTGIDIQCNLRDVDAPKQIVDATVKAFGQDIDILVNNAATISDKFLGDITPEHFDEVFQYVSSFDGRSTLRQMQNEQRQSVSYIKAFLSKQC